MPARDERRETGRSTQRWMIFPEPSFEIGPKLCGQRLQLCDFLFGHSARGFIGGAIALLPERIEPPDNFCVKHNGKCQRFDRNGMMPRNIAVRAVT